jgi:hypothetical protein
MAYKTKKKKALPRRKKEDIFPKKAKGLKAKVRKAVTKVKLAKVRRLAKKGDFGPGQPKAVKPSKRKARKGQRAAKKALKGMGPNVGIGVVGEKKKSAKAKARPKKAKTSVFHLKKGTKVRKGAVGVQKTKGGEYVKYGKKSEAAGSFRKAFKAGCAGGAKSFSWDGRSYSCKKK